MPKSRPKTSPMPAADVQPKVIPFYSDREGKRFREFSNFYKDAAPFEFVLPSFARREGLPDRVNCEFSEKAVMITKAAMMGDEKAFHAISAASNPKDAKELGRGVNNFNQE